MVPRRRLDMRARRYQGRLFVANGAETFELDETAEFIFKQVDGEATLRQIGERVATRYGIDVSRAVAETAELLTQLETLGVIKV
jgi:pyrroloquinoline quinone biosynthesis protein D